MKAFILSAGLGTRLGVLTKDKPKALVEFNGKPMLQGVIERLKSQGFNQFCINVHHHAEKIIRFVEKHHFFNVDIVFSDERQALLDTGGALVKASDFFKGDENVLVHNVDIYISIDFSRVMKAHTESHALTTLLVKNRKSTRKLIFNETLTLKGWKDLKNNRFLWADKPLPHYLEKAFSGAYIASPELPFLLKKEGAFPIVPAWIELSKNHTIKGFEHNGLWFDLGTPEKIKTAESIINSSL